jgi:hypothetical protein
MYEVFVKGDNNDNTGGLDNSGLKHVSLPIFYIA